MRRVVASIAVGSLLAGGLALAAPAASAASSSLRAGHALHRGHQLVSPNGRFHAAVERSGRLVIRTKAGTAVWRTPKGARNSMLYLGRTGRLIVKSGATVRWGSGTSGSGSSNVLTMRNDGVLAMTAGGLAVWTSRLTSRCPHIAKRALDIDLSAQTARMCRAGQQLRVTRVTTGARAKGYATPKGTWHVYAKVRKTTLHPAAGGAYPVKYWVPYSGPYGVHDSSWQKFAYGSSRYKTRGSHGCTHVPAKAMAWFYKWVRIGTTVRVHR